MLTVGTNIVLLGAWAYKAAVNTSWGGAMLKSYYTLNSVPGGAGALMKPPDEAFVRLM